VIKHLLLAGTTDLSATTNQRRPLPMQTPNYATIYGSTHTDINPGNFHDIGPLLVIFTLRKWFIRADISMIVWKICMSWTTVKTVVYTHVNGDMWW